MSMNELERLRRLLEERFPTADYKTLRPRGETGNWWLDVTLGEQALTIEWRPGRGFGLSTPTEDDMFSGPDEVHPDVGSAFQRAQELLLSLSI